MRKFEFKIDDVFRPCVRRLYCNDEPITNNDSVFDFSVSYDLNRQFIHIQNMFNSIPNISKEEKLDIFNKYQKLRNEIKVDFYVD